MNPEKSDDGETLQKDDNKPESDQKQQQPNTGERKVPSKIKQPGPELLENPKIIHEAEPDVFKEIPEAKDENQASYGCLHTVQEFFVNMMTGSNASKVMPKQKGMDTTPSDKRCSSDGFERRFYQISKISRLPVNVKENTLLGKVPAVAKSTDKVDLKAKVEPKKELDHKAKVEAKKEPVKEPEHKKELGKVGFKGQVGLKGREEPKKKEPDHKDKGKVEFKGKVLKGREEPKNKENPKQHNKSRKKSSKKNKKK